MPFITEEVWQVLKEADEADCIVSTYPVAGDLDAELIKDFDTLQTIVTAIRDTRNQNQIAPKEALPISVLNDNEVNTLFSRGGYADVVCKIAYVSELSFVGEGEGSGYAFIVGKSKYYLESNKELDVESELKKLEEELGYQIGFVGSVGKKLDNASFVNNAPAKVVDMERKKMADGEARIQLIKEQIEKLKQMQ